MRIDAQSLNVSSLLNSFAKPAVSGNTGAVDFDASQRQSANSAVSNGVVLPSGASVALPMEVLVALQSHEEPAPVEEAPSAADLFLEEAHKNPIERLREQILEELGLTEEDLAALPTEERAAIEDKIAQMIEERLRENGGIERASADATAPSFPIA